MPELRYYQTKDLKQPYARWFKGVNAIAAAKITVALTRLGNGNTSNVASVGEGVSELKIDFGPGYRVYFGRDGEKLIILLSGGTKQGQEDDIKTAKGYWRDYKERKKPPTKSN